MAVAVFALCTVGCATTPADPLGPMHPYLWVAEGELEWLTCRWSTESPIGVAILGTDDRETLVIEAALAAWEDAGIGVRFTQVPPSGAQLQLRSVESGLRRDNGTRAAALTIVDCQLQEAAAAAPRAALVSAEITLARTVGPDFRGRSRELSASEHLGAWVHEIGHALGYQGHWRRGDDPMRVEPDFQRLVGERLRAGGRLTSPALAALYRRPSGTTLRRDPVPVERTADVTRLAELARGADLAGPFLRSGDTFARIFWKEADGREYGVQIPVLEKLLDDPKWFHPLPEPAARRELR